MLDRGARMRGPRALALDSVPPDLLEGVAPGASYRCDSPEAILVPLAAVRGPISRKLNREALESLAAALRSGAALPPVAVYMKGEQAILLDGMHRWRISLAAGFTHLRCLCKSRDAAELGYGYVDAGDSAPSP
jgi:ParB-like nuclease family protein